LSKIQHVSWLQYGKYLIVTSIGSSSWPIWMNFKRQIHLKYMIWWSPSYQCQPRNAVEFKVVHCQYPGITSVIMLPWSFPLSSFCLTCAVQSSSSGTRNELLTAVKNVLFSLCSIKAAW
jgi:hypothetical protein